MEGVARSPAGRPQSAYPYRDLPDTPSRWESQTTPALLTGAKDSFFGEDREFHPFPRLPVEPRLQVWKEVALAACEYGRVHRVRVAIAEPPPTGRDSPRKGSTLELVATSQLADSTFTPRAVLATCHEARQEALSFIGIVPDTLPLQGGGVFRCDLAQDVIMFEDLTPALLLQIHSLRSHAASLAPIRHLGLDLASPAHLGAFLTGADGIPPALEAALVSFAASLPQLEQIYLLQATATLHPVPPPEPPTPPPPPISPTAALPQQNPLNVADWYATTPDAQAPDSFFPGTITITAAATATDWYTTRPAPSYWVDDAYYLHLSRLMRLLCGLRTALDGASAAMQLPMSMGEDEDEAGRLARLQGVLYMTLTKE
ncbi:hypothetical protein BT67DRAFT_435899 [Trichocladium antarcticum]|uniref:2EXR domain-containing protein n=1 Tax=Trichocladium antarcticum TaxID=1450529 RepID=A0AAN6ZBP5_9PEZI|nr:hypothetical protein BT67DRAFT_435899 [Trichocladium antarcticum]